MASAVTNIIVIIATLLIGLTAFVLYAQFAQYVVNSTYDNKLAQQMTQDLEFSASLPYTYAILNSSPITFNISELAWIYVHGFNGNLTLVVFNVSGNPNNLYYYIPSLHDTLHFSVNVGGKKALNNTATVGQLFTPSGKELNDSVVLNTFTVPNGATVYLSGKALQGQIIVIWVLADPQNSTVLSTSGHTYIPSLYRLAIEYVNPTATTEGYYTVLSTGDYKANNNNLGVNPPLYLSSQKGMYVGMWFEPLSEKGGSVIATFGFSSVSVNVPPYDINVSIYNGVLNISLYIPQIEKTLTSIPLVKVRPNSFYYINFSMGAQTTDSLEVYQEGKSKPIYSSNSVILNLLNPLQGSANGYTATVRFGYDNDRVVAITQAFLATQFNNANLGGIYQVNNNMTRYGPLYDETYLLNQYFTLQSTSTAPFNSLVYWYFVYPTYPPPSSIDAYIWVLTNGGNPAYNLGYIMESGQNTYYLS